MSLDSGLQQGSDSGNRFPVQPSQFPRPRDPRLAPQTLSGEVSPLGSKKWDPREAVWQRKMFFFCPTQCSEFLSSSYLPELGTDLVTALSSLDMNDLPHVVVLKLVALGELS